jgi:hypothetical protein
METLSPKSRNRKKVSLPQEWDSRIQSDLHAQNTILQLQAKFKQKQDRRKESDQSTANPQTVDQMLKQI